MKRGRILSLFLSAVLLVSAIIPCLQLSVNADRSNAISEIKSAWNQLKYETMEAFKPSKNFDKDKKYMEYVELYEKIFNQSRRKS